MGGAVPPLPQYAFIAWCSVRGSTGTTLLYFYLYESETWVSRPDERIQGAEGKKI
jgi:hypothetical protein